jgi:FMN-dependent NADH-azoreductase
MPATVLHIDASVRLTDSVSRDLSAKVMERFAGATVIRRDLAQALPPMDATWIDASFTPADARTQAQKETLALSGALISELEAADTIVIGTPMYNFSIPSGLKVWVDLVARAGVTFEYTDAGPRGLLTGKRVIVALATGGTALDSEIDFAGRYLRHVLGFIGLTDITFIAADRLAIDHEGALARAQTAVADLAA